MSERRAAVSTGVLLSVLSAALYAPLLGRFASGIPNDAGDPLLNTWILWWNTQRLPLTEAYWHAPIFAPIPHTFALSETLLGLTWLTTPLQWLGATPLVAYNTIFVLVPVLNGLSAWWLCLIVTGRRDAALIGGLAFAFAPYHAAQLSHLQVNASFCMPLALVGLHRYWSSRQWRWLALLALALAVNGFVSGYFLLYFGVLLGLAIGWLTVATRDLRALGGVLLAIGVAVLLLSPAILEYQHVQREMDLRRPISEVESLSADLVSFGWAAPSLVLWPVKAPIHRPELALYPGVALVLLLAAAGYAAIRNRRAVTPERWRHLSVRTLSALSIATVMVGIVVLLLDDSPYKVFGVAIDLALIALLLSSRFKSLVTSGTLPAMYACGAAVASLLALGPVARVLGNRFWYKPPFAWLLPLPGFDAVRVPARFTVIQILCLSVLAAFAFRTLWPQRSRASALALAVAAAALVADGWMRLPVADIPKPLPVTVQGDLVIELPVHSYVEDVSAMYRAMSHGRPVVNGYSGWVPPQYVTLQQDLRNECVASLEQVRGGRSMDAIIWRSDSSAPAIDAGLRRLWPGATREETADVIVYRQPRSQAQADGQNPRRCP